MYNIMPVWNNSCYNQQNYNQNYYGYQAPTYNAFNNYNNFGLNQNYYNYQTPVYNNYNSYDMSQNYYNYQTPVYNTSNYIDMSQNYYIQTLLYNIAQPAVNVNINNYFPVNNNSSMQNNMMFGNMMLNGMMQMFSMMLLMSLFTQLIPEEPEDVYLIGSYEGDSLENLLKEYSSNEDGSGNDAKLQELLAKFEENGFNDENVGDQEVLVVNKDGEILDRISYDEFDNLASGTGVGTTRDSEEEGTGGSLVIDGKEYNVVASALDHANDQVYLLGSYYGNNLQSLVNAYANNGNANDALLKELLTQLEEAGTTNESIGSRQILVVNQDGEVVDRISYNQFNGLTNGTGVGTGHGSAVEGVGGTIIINEEELAVLASVIKHSPLTFDLNGDGVKTSNRIVSFDIDGDGDLDLINDVADGTLCINGGDNGSELFGNNTDLDGDGKADGYKDGFEALKALAAREGLINNADDMILDSEDIKKLEEKYDLAMKTGGYNSQTQSLLNLGITEINLGASDKTESIDNFDGLGNTIMTQDGATFKINGQEREYADIWHALIA